MEGKDQGELVMVCEDATQRLLRFAKPRLLFIDAWVFYKYPIFVNKVNLKVKDSILDVLPGVASALPVFGCTGFVTGLS